jgi:hypothetical protein
MIKIVFLYINHQAVLSLNADFPEKRRDLGLCLNLSMILGIIDDDDKHKVSFNELN